MLYLRIIFSRSPECVLEGLALALESWLGQYSRLLSIFLDSFPGCKKLGCSHLPGASQENIIKITEWYAGNPLFIKLVANRIHEFFGDSIEEFLAQNTLVCGNIRIILDEQFNRLSSLEKQIMYCLAVNPSFISLQTIESNILPGLPQHLLLKGIELLQKRSLIERQASSYSLTPVLREYIIERFIEEHWKLSAEKAGSLLITHTFLAKQLKNYIKASR